MINMIIKQHLIVSNSCNESEDSNEHMLIECGKVKTLWTEVENWIAEVGVVDYRIIILGELQTAHWINAVIILTKKTIFNSRTNNTCPTFVSIKNRWKTITYMKNLNILYVTERTNWKKYGVLCWNILKNYNT